jgi:endonuclease/exonuclease/phosphatase family metal-dependent hydrolase
MSPAAGLARSWLTGLFLFVCLAGLRAGESFSVATYNLETYDVETNADGLVKSRESREKIRESIQAIDPDVLALQEIEGVEALQALRASLNAHGLSYPYWELAPGADTNRQVAILSKLPFLERIPHADLTFLLHGRRHRASRGFAEVRIRATPAFSFNLIAAHLKSRRQVTSGDEEELREQESILLREIIDQRLAANLPLLVAGDFNDTKASRAVRNLMGKGKLALVDLRPAERNGDNQPNPIPRFEPRNIVWTHYYGKEDTYSRLDYILASRGLARACDPEGTYVLALPNWGVASDHRPVVARFIVGNTP